MAIEFRHLRSVIAATERGSIRRAAALLRLRQSTLSRQIRLLEEELGVALFERHSGGVRATLAGREIVRAAQHLIERVEDMISTARSVGRGEMGHLTLGFYTSLSTGRLRALLASYAREYPDVVMTPVEWPRGRLLDGIRNGDVDVAIVAGALKEHDYPSLSIWSERIVVALPASHPLATREALYWTDLKGQSFVLSRRDPGPDIADIVVAKLSSPGDMPHIESCDMSNENVLALLATGRGVSAHCESAVGLAYTGIVYREARDISGPTYIGFTAYWRNDNRNPTLARFLDLLRKLHAPLAG